MSFFVKPSSVRFVVRSRSCTIKRSASPSSEPSPWLKIRANAPNLSGLALQVYSTTTGSITARPTPCVISLRPLAGCSIPWASVTPAVLITIPPMVLARVTDSQAFVSCFSFSTSGLPLATAFTCLYRGTRYCANNVTA